MMIREGITVSDEILASGGFANIRTGTYKGCLVAVKTMRVAKQDDLVKIRKVSIYDHLGYSRHGSDHPQQFYKEAILWNALSHPNVLKFAGVQGDVDKGEFITICEWMAHGNIMEFIKNNCVNRLGLVRGFTAPATPFTETRVQLHGAAQGLSYLHDCASLAHGDIKGVSINLFHNYSSPLISSRQTFTCPTTILHVPASRTSDL